MRDRHRQRRSNGRFSAGLAAARGRPLEVISWNARALHHHLPPTISQHNPPTISFPTLFTPPLSPTATAAAAGSEGDTKMAKKVVLGVLVFLIVAILFFSLLGMTIEIHGKMSGIQRIEDGVNAIKEHLNLTGGGGK